MQVTHSQECNSPEIEQEELRLFFNHQQGCRDADWTLSWTNALQINHFITLCIPVHTEN